MLTKLSNNLNKPTPKWAGTIRNIAIALITASGAVLVSPLALPIAIITACGYVSLASTVLATIMQSFVTPEAKN